MTYSSSRRRTCVLGAVILVVALGAGLGTAQAQSYQQSTDAGGGTLSWTVSQSTGPCGPTGYGWTFTEWNFSSFQYNDGSATYPLSGTATYLQDNNSSEGCPPDGSQPSTLPLTLPSSTFGNAAVEFTAASGGGGQAFIQSTGEYDPAYKVVSILYSPPGNQSSQGYTDTTTNGTTSSVGTSFTYAQQLIFSSGIKNVLGGTASWGFSTTSWNNSAFTQSWTDATAVATDDNSNAAYNPTGSNALNHNLDTFEIWLNPQVTVVTNNSTPVTYSISSQATSGESSTLADVIGVPAISMEPIPGSISSSNPSGISSVKASALNPIPIATGSGTDAYLPGLASICKNLNLTEYDAGHCTQADQCGCTPADFAGILAQDALLNYSTSTNTANPTPGTTDPTTLDGSGQTTCEASSISSGSNCRYIPVPYEQGSTTPLFEPLSGAQSLTYTQSDATTSTFTSGSGVSNSVGVSFGGGVEVASLKTQNTWTWSNSESSGTSSGSGNSLSLTLKTSTAACQENVNVFEDTVYHTFVFQIPSGNLGCN